jgi:hypothetical protein
LLAQCLCAQLGYTPGWLFEDARELRDHSPRGCWLPKRKYCIDGTQRSPRLKFHLERLGHKLDKDELYEVYKRFLTLADSKLDINDDDLQELMAYKLVKN